MKGARNYDAQQRNRGFQCNQSFESMYAYHERIGDKRKIPITRIERNKRGTREQPFSEDKGRARIKVHQVSRMRRCAAEIAHVW